ncbi:uncharacterized protein SCHCODRAFT_02192238 [Schizophyllum commune H4-8]|uniref:uncharacterized protein n=1 Tax=Schizophyllum commune (strain H4-8 / FGSC 9210) TaxID=578458 RepID=UPI00215E3157|nr:uncharacterized protein SCHCODRAFT_02192238 [Schizophyllum commune H4-8]KAI5896473.1 hypothetical protein SCHCODRAFT_02192238 [Schizophyllum commune H4-8]
MGPATKGAASKAASPAQANGKASAGADRPALYTLRYLSSESTLPQIPAKKASKLARALHLDFGKSKDKKANNRTIYATFILDDGEGKKPATVNDESKRCDLGEKEVSINFSARGTSKLKIALYAEGNKGKDDLLASKECDMTALATERQLAHVTLDIVDKSLLSKSPRLALEIKVERIGQVDTKELAAPLAFPEKWVKMERHVRALLAIGDVLSEMDPRAKMVISLLNLGFEVSTTN